MLFGIDFCGGRQRARRRRPYRGRGFFSPALMIGVGCAVFLALLFLAPQWLLVLLVALLTAALIAALCIPSRR